MAKPIKPVQVKEVKEVKSRVDSYSNGRAIASGLSSGGILAWVITRSREFVKFDCFHENATGEVTEVLVRASLCDEIGFEKAFEKTTGRDKADIISFSESVVHDERGEVIAA